MYILIEYSDNHWNKSESLWQFNRHKLPDDNADLSVVNNDLNSQWVKYKVALLEKTATAVNGC